MKENKELEKSNFAGNWICSSTALGALVFALTSEPVWIAVGVAIGAALAGRDQKIKSNLWRWLRLV
jgi:hypothetical protein